MRLSLWGELYALWGQRLWLRSRSLSGCAKSGTNLKTRIKPGSFGPLFSVRPRNETDDPQAVRSERRSTSVLAGFFEHHRQSNVPVANHLFGDDQLLDLLVARHVVHQVQHQLLEDHAQATRAHLALQRL